MRAPRRRLQLRGIERWLWTGPVGHFVGGALDLAQALVHYYRSRPRRARTRVGAAGCLKLKRLLRSS